MNKLFSALLILVIGVMFVPVVQNSVATYDQVGGSYTHTALVDSVSDEDVDMPVDVDYVKLDSVYVNGVKLDESKYDDLLVSNKYITLYGDASDLGDEIVVNYTYVSEMTAGVDGLVNVVFILFVVGVVAGGLAYIKFK